MQKKLIALAIASAMTVPALAYAEVNISGQANVSIDMVNDGNSPSASANQLTSNQSRVVLKGSDDLGNGLSAIYSLDHRFSVDTGVASTPFWGGDAYVGLKSNDFGTLRLGRMDTPYKSAFRKLDLFYDVAGDNRVNVGAAGGGLFETDLRMNNSIIYNSPNFSGFTVSAGSVFGAETPSSLKKGQALNFAGTYSTDNIYAAFAYQSVKYGANVAGNDLGGTPDDEDKSWKLGGGYTMDVFTLNAEIEGTTITPVGGTATTGTNLYIAGRFGISSTDGVRLAYTRHGETKTGTSNQDGANQLAIGYEHGMSKATSVYATYVKTTADVGYAGFYGVGGDPSAISFGVKHAF